MTEPSLRNSSKLVSSLNWNGMQSAKFKGGRLHDNHPKDQLDNFISSSKSTDIGNIGKKQFSSQNKDRKHQGQRFHLRIFQAKYKKSTVFNQENIQKLIKVPFTKQEDSLGSLISNISDKYHYETIGTSKIKAMQNGIKKHGIYRNFYNSQAKSLNILKGIS